MKLFFTPTSPYARKVCVLLIEKGLHDSIEFIPVDFEKPLTALVHENPLGKVPTLIRQDGKALFDSPIVCEYLDSLGTGPNLYPSGEARWTALRQLAIADGSIDALSLRRQELRRPEDLRSSHQIELQKMKSDRGLTTLEDEVSHLAGPITIGHIAVGCCLGYLDFRFAQEPWRKEHPKLALWFEEFEKRPSMLETNPSRSQK